MKKIILIMTLSVLSLLNSCFDGLSNTQTRIVRFEAVGSISNADIYFGTSRGFAALKSISLPWSSGKISVDFDDDDGGEDPVDCIIRVINNTDDSGFITVRIYIDGKDVAVNTGFGPHVLVGTGYTIEAKPEYIYNGTID